MAEDADVAPVTNVEDDADANTIGEEDDEAKTGEVAGEEGLDHGDESETIEKEEEAEEEDENGENSEEEVEVGEEEEDGEQEEIDKEEDVPKTMNPQDIWERLQSARSLQFLSAPQRKPLSTSTTENMWNNDLYLRSRKIY